MCIDIKDYYFGAVLLEPEYMTISLKYIPVDIQTKYNLRHLAQNSSAVLRIESTVYELTSVGQLSQNRLIAHLVEHVHCRSNTHDHRTVLCYLSQVTHRHKSNAVAFSLVVDDFW